MTAAFTQARYTVTPLVAALRRCAGAFGLVFAYSCGYNIFLLAPSLYLLQIYDRVLSSRSVDTLLMLTIIIAIAVIVGSLLDIVRRAALSRIGSWLDRQLRPVVMNASFEYAARTDAGTAAENYRDLSVLRQFLDSPSCALLFDIPWAPVFLVLLFLVHPLLGFIGLSSALCLLLLALLNEFTTRELNEQANIAQARSYSRFTMALKYIGVIRAMGMQHGAAHLIYRDAEAVRAAQDGVARRTEVLQAFSKSVRALTQILMMGAATWLVLQNNSNPGIIFVASLLLGRGLAPVEGAIGAWRALAFVRGAFNRLNKMLTLVAPGDNKRTILLPEPKGQLVLDNVGYRFPSSALQDRENPLSDEFWPAFHGPPADVLFWAASIFHCFAIATMLAISAICRRILNFSAVRSKMSSVGSTARIRVRLSKLPSSSGCMRRSCDCRRDTKPISAKVAPCFCGRNASNWDWRAQPMATLLSWSLMIRIPVSTMRVSGCCSTP